MGGVRGVRGASEASLLRATLPRNEPSVTAAKGNAGSFCDHNNSLLLDPLVGNSFRGPIGSSQPGGLNFKFSHKLNSEA